MDSKQAIFEQQPPMPTNYWVQKLERPLNDGSTIILRVKYIQEKNLPQLINLYNAGRISYTLKDDGQEPDQKANDGIYATYVNENIDQFIKTIQEKEAIVDSKGGVLHFEGHSGAFINTKDIDKFDLEAFNSNAQVPINAFILDATSCNASIKKQNSLFITDLGVVEDPARTYNVTNNTGNPIGAWTFGKLMKNIANTSVTNGTRDFLKAWVKTWTVDQTVGDFANNINPHMNVPVRYKAIMHLIVPWLIKANNGTLSLPINYNADTTWWKANWEATWDAIPESNIVTNAPFKLMAIVNRLDLRGSSGYTPMMNNAGETRFIYTLINPLTGKPPIHDNITQLYDSNPEFANGTQSGAIDWVGMNVILEFGNPIANTCALQDFAKQWYDLSQYNLNSPTDLANFNADLQAITNQVTAAGAGGAKNFNHSAINQIRTNEKIFELQIQNGQSANWDQPDWELRQFSLNTTDGFLHNIEVSNTPVDEKEILIQNGTSLNNAENINLFNNVNAFADPKDFTNWIFSSASNMNRIAIGNHNIPTKYLDGKARIYKEASHYWGWTFGLLPSNIYNPVTYNIALDAQDLQSKKIRHQISLNTCQGCHGGETKTNFTQLYPRGYGEPANYWDAIPSIVSNTPSPTAPQYQNLTLAIIDPRFNTNQTNTGNTYDKFTLTNEKNLNLAEKKSNNTNQIVSPFLTGRLYSSATSNNWQDDELNDAGNEAPLNANQNQFPLTYLYSDEKLTGLYYVNDPSNQSLSIPNGVGILPGKGGNFPQLHTQRWGYNDLQHRQDDLCNFIKNNCLGNFDAPFEVGRIFPLIERINFMPLPLNAE